MNYDQRSYGCLGEPQILKLGTILDLGSLAFRSPPCLEELQWSIVSTPTTLMVDGATTLDSAIFLV